MAKFYSENIQVCHANTVQHRNNIIRSWRCFDMLSTGYAKRIEP